MYEPGYKPKLRAVDILPADEEKRAFVLRDPLGYSSKTLVFSQQVLPLLSLMDGEHDLRDLQAEASRVSGELVFLDTIVELVRMLDDNLFLDSEFFKNEKKRLEEEFAKKKVRIPILAGRSYPAGKRELEELLDDLFSSFSYSGPTPKALIAPHVDLRLGAKAFAAAYNTWRDLKPQSKIIILGTGHYLDDFFSFTAKNFVTPFGEAKTDQGLLEEIKINVDPSLTSNEWFHKQEHSVELQVVCLQYILKEKPFSILPVLCGGFQPFILQKKAPENEERYEKVISFLKRLIADENVYLVAGVDFSHLGSRYGDPYRAGESDKIRALTHDRDLLESILSLDAESFFEKIAAGDNSYRVCGVASLYTLVKLLQGKDLKGKLFLQDAVSIDEGSIVSFAAAGFTKA